MIRFLMIKREKLISGCESKLFYTIDNDIVALEKALTSGGSGEDQYETHSLIGAEVINTTNIKGVGYER
tara:strand:- start:1473 stop:1679 length:207 start_codon:yes stop_codon:yes gene_type:complete